MSLLVLFGLWMLFGGGLHVMKKSGKALVALAPRPIATLSQESAVLPAHTPTSVAATPIPTIFTPTTIPATSTPAPTATALPVSTATPTVANTIAPTATLQEKASPTATAASTATATPTATASSTPTLTATPTATPTATTTPTPKPQPDVYVVQPGDTLISIAQKVHRTVEALAAYNNISDPTTIRVGQELRIPPQGYVPPTATPRRPTKTPVPTATATPSITLPAPQLIGPGNNSSASGPDARISLEWQALPGGLPAGDEYVVYIGVLVGPNQVSWRVQEPVGYDTHFQVPGWLFGQAPQEFGRAYEWYIQAAKVSRNGDQVQIIPVSQPSEHRRFYWN